jgi:hypothetical protein
MSTVTAPATSSGLEDMGNRWGKESGICPIWRREQIRGVWVNRLQKNEKNEKSILIFEMTHKPSFAFIITLLPRHSMSHTSPLCHSAFGCQRFFYPIGVGNMSHVVHLHITLGCVAIPFRTPLCRKPLRTCSLVLATRPPPPSHTTTRTPLVSVLIRRLMSSGSPVFGPHLPFSHDYSLDLGDALSRGATTQSTTHLLNVSPYRALLCMVHSLCCPPSYPASGC